ncbi:phosphoglycerate kinase [Acetobacteraceae bacterium]|nr:phosphoglycerate kinase [Candidatus Parcubacteria bacterium]
MQEVKSIREADVRGKRVLVRVVLNVPLQNGAVTDDLRLRAIVPTLEFLDEKGAASITLMGYVGRPEGKVVEELRTAPVAAKLRELTNVTFEVLENLRFDPREESNDEGFAKELATHGEIYVNDAFADSHRAYASTVGVTKFLPSYAGLLLEEEIKNLSEALTPPANSLAIIGGAKFQTKQPLLEKLLTTYGKVFLGGALGNDLLKARGMPVGASLVSPMPVPMSIAGNDRLIIPADIALIDEKTGGRRTTNTADVRAGEKIFDIGPETIKNWSAEISKASFVLWNGPLGVFEKGFAEGTQGLASALAQAPCRAIVGGGDTIAALSKFKFDPKRIFISTGGGAMLEFLANGTLAGIEALKR